MSKIGFLNKHATHIRKIFGILILLAVGFIASGIDTQSFFTKKENTTPIVNVNGLHNALENPYIAPEFTGIEAWLNSPPLTMQALKGKVVLIDFWTYSCINCVRTLPYITQWNKTYKDKGLVIIGIHAPEFEFEKNINSVKAALQHHAIEYPIAIDNKLDTWTAFKNRYWPAHYLINQEGKIVYTHFGEGNYAETENNIRHLLNLDGKTHTTPQAVTSTKNQTPETYLGYDRSQNFTSPEMPTGDSDTFYLPTVLPLHHWALSGKWNTQAERIISQKTGSKIQLHFKAKKVFLVLGTENGKTIKSTLSLNGKPLGGAAGKDVIDSTLTVSNHTLYELVNQASSENGILELTTSEVGLEAYAFTFGD